MQSLKTTLFITAAILIGGGELNAQDHDHAVGEDPVVIEVDMADHSFSPNSLRIPVGRPVTLVFENTGSVPHEFMAGRNVAEGDFGVDLFEGVEVEIGAVSEAEPPADHAHAEPSDHAHADEPDADAVAHTHEGDDHGTMVLLEPEARTTMTFTLPEDRQGEWMMACFVQDHYEQGMRGAVTVY